MTRNITVDAENDNKATPTAGDKVPLVDVATSPDTLKEAFVSSLGLPLYKIAPSISSNNLVLNITHLDDSAVSATAPLSFRVGSTIYALTSSPSFQKNAATNWANLGSAELAALPHDLFVYAIGETGGSAGLKFGFSRIPYAITMNDFVNTTTSEKYIAGNWTNFNTSDAVANIGRFRAQLSAGAGYTWSIPSTVIVNHPIYETGVLTWAPAWSASGSMTYASVTTSHANYRVQGRACHIQVQGIGTIGGTPSHTVLATGPFNALNNASQPAMTAWVIADTSAEASFSFMDTTNANRIGFRRTGSTNWVAGANKYANGNGIFFIA